MSDLPSRLWTGRYGTLLIATLFAYTGFMMLVPTYTAHLRALGADDVAAGLGYSLSSLSALMARGGSGGTMDRIGRKPVLITGLAILFIVNLTYALTDDITLIWVLRFAQGIGWGMTSTALATVVSDVVPRHRLGEGIGYFALSIVLATSISVILGIRLMDALGFGSVIIATSVLFLAGFALCALLPAPPFSRTGATATLPTPTRQTAALTLFTRLFEPRAVLPAFLCFLHSIAFSGIMAFIMLFGREAGIDAIWAYFLGHLAMIMASRPFAGRLFDRRGHQSVILPGTALMIIGLIILSFAHSVPVLVVASVFYGCGFGTVQPSLQAWAIQRSPVDRKGAASGTFLSSLDLGYAIGVVIMGAIAGWVGYAMMYRLATVLLIALAVIYLVAIRYERSARHLDTATATARVETP